MPFVQEEQGAKARANIFTKNFPRTALPNVYLRIYLIYSPFADGHSQAFGNKPTLDFGFFLVPSGQDIDLCSQKMPVPCPSQETSE